MVTNYYVEYNFLNFGGINDNFDCFIVKNSIFVR